MASAPSLIKTALGPYVLTERIGQGGVAEVYQATHRDDGSVAAVKVMRLDRCEDPFHRKGLASEYELLKRLSHGGIPTVRRFGELQGRPALAMSFVQGRSVQDLMASGSLIPGPHVLMELIAIVAYLHGEGVVHNDLKLENVMFGAGQRVTLVDFGNVREPGREGLMRKLFRPKPKAIFGTATYLAPELIAGGLATTQSDVYALGVCAFLLLSGSPPFTASSQSSRIRANQKAAPPHIGQRVSTVPPTCALAIDSCLAKDPADRPENAVVLISSLKGLLDGVRRSTAVPILKG